jgi:hypothetical protein
VQDALYNTQEEQNNSISNYYEYATKEGFYTIECKKGTYKLQLDGISLRIFNTGVAILAFNLKNTSYSKASDILAINDFGRRIYPQFLGQNFLKEPKETLLAKRISLMFNNGKEIVEEFNSFTNLETIIKAREKFLPSFIKELIAPNFKKVDSLRPIIDDRMFVISQYHNDALTRKMQSYSQECGYGYETDEFWYKYVFVDGDSKTCQSRYMTKKLINESTYDRWVEWGTLFGVSRYSFVVLTGSGYGKSILLPHMQTMYFQMFTLLLTYRATIIKFSDDIQNVTQEGDTSIVAETKKLYKKYLSFLNKLYFKEVTAQEQGIELYNQAMKIMDIDKYMHDLDNEMNELHAYATMVEEKETARSMNLLTYIGGILLPPSLITSFLGMNTLSGLGEYAWFEKSQSGLWALGVTVGSAFIVPIYLKFFKKEHHE